MIDLSVARKNFDKQAVRTRFGQDPEVVLKHVADKIDYLSEEKATPDTVWKAKKEAIKAIADLAKSQSGWFVAGIIGFFESAAIRYQESRRVKNAVHEVDSNFCQFNGITDKDAIAAYRSGEATIRELFELQPSIFIGK